MEALRSVSFHVVHPQEYFVIEESRVLKDISGTTLDSYHILSIIWKIRKFDSFAILSLIDLKPKDFNNGHFVSLVNLLCMSSVEIPPPVRRAFISLVINEWFRSPLEPSKIDTLIAVTPLEIPPDVVKAIKINGGELKNMPRNAKNAKDVSNITYKEVRSLSEMDRITFPQSIDIYTDGSKTDSAVGYALVVYKYKEDHNEVKRLPPSATTSQAELVGLLSALEYVKSSSSISRVRIFTDSKSALQALNGSSQTDEHISQCRQLLSYLDSRGTTVDFVWTKAHVGIPGNERAHELARMSTDPKTSNNFPMSVLSPILSGFELFVEKYPDEYNKLYPILKEHFASPKVFEMVRSTLTSLGTSSQEVYLMSFDLLELYVEKDYPFTNKVRGILLHMSFKIKTEENRKRFMKILDKVTINPGLWRIVMKNINRLIG